MGQSMSRRLQRRERRSEIFRSPADPAGASVAELPVLADLIELSAVANPPKPVLWRGVALTEVNRAQSCRDVVQAFVRASERGCAAYGARRASASAALCGSRGVAAGADPSTATTLPASASGSGSGLGVGLDDAAAAAGDHELPVDGGELVGAEGVGAGPREEVAARAGVLLHGAAAGGEDVVAALHGDDAADHVDGEHAVGVVVAGLADDAEGAAAEAGGALPAAALAEEAEVLGPVEAGLALAALPHGVDGALLQGADVARERVGVDEAVQGGDVGEALAAEEDGVLAAEHGRVDAVAGVGRDAGAVEGGEELLHGGVAAGDAAEEGGGLAALGPAKRGWSGKTAYPCVSAMRLLMRDEEASAKSFGEPGGPLVT
jgi:hypothetical protein